MESLCRWILSKVNFLRYKIVGLPETEPPVPPPWSLESPFEKWTIYSKASLAAAVACFLIFIILHSRRQSTVPKMMMINRRLAATPINDLVVSESCILDTWLYHLALLLILCLFISIPWEWVRLYQIEVAKKATILSEGYARSCYQQDLSFWETLKIWLSWNFSWGSDCESYYKALMVDPLWEVTPLMAISSVIARFVVHPMELFSHTIGRSLRNIMREIPSQWQLPVFLLFPLTFISILITALTKRKDAICHQTIVTNRSRTSRAALMSRT
ncbi:chloride channel CLIC-like protein 1 [Hyla sarda]|uniref:chloride channel CLIC-like protein 1 n=1 Tax=Hyla sarda TaxID=327740 RepID=UPI0024C37681|nr:chloride channel CLIC-like protein 1 [Hyla sarda]XP_056403970.1 chloride channel CLIC-like protein 1 [Hyla sarda]XP_056403971.1 chloride channel CLIC-like protein 1 [Hyla sarda]XP_056403972.1 chloride channel CLIC-like protein 1 [Hyla sarda]